MEAAFRYRMATRLARRLREAGRPLPLPALGEALGLRGPVERVVRPLLDGRFLLEEGVGLWEWRYPFPLEGRRWWSWTWRPRGLPRAWTR